VSVLFLLLPVALAIVAVAIGAFVWAARRGQFDDLDTPALRVLRDDEPAGRRTGTPPPEPDRSDPPV
jgi:cbb3-type cytochrome oxidase maturation protein